MNSKLKTFFFLLLTATFFSCIEEERFCTKKVNIPLWDEEKQVFVDNFKDLPCDYDGSINKVSKPN